MVSFAVATGFQSSNAYAAIAANAKLTASAVPTIRHCRPAVMGGGAVRRTGSTGATGNVSASSISFLDEGARFEDGGAEGPGNGAALTTETSVGAAETAGEGADGEAAATRIDDEEVGSVPTAGALCSVPDEGSLERSGGGSARRVRPTEDVRLAPPSVSEPG
jgi:hypothetical protein